MPMIDFDSYKNPVDCKCIKVQQNKNKVIKSKGNMCYTNITKGRAKTSNIGFKLEDGRCIIGYGSNLLLVETDLVNYKVYKSIHYEDTLLSVDNETYFKIINNLDVMSPEFKKFLQENKLSFTKPLDDRDVAFVKRYLEEYGCIRPNKVDLDFLEGIVPQKLKMNDVVVKV